MLKKLPKDIVGMGESGHPALGGLLWQLFCVTASTQFNLLMLLP
jgi:hypothetical protein